jgi:hypothetical protein
VLIETRSARLRAIPVLAPAGHGHETHVSRALALAQKPSEFVAIESGETDVEQSDFRRDPARCLPIGLRPATSRAAALAARVRRSTR